MTAEGIKRGKEVRGRSEDFWSNTRRSALNSTYILAQVLVDCSLPVRISRVATDANGNRLSHDVAIYAEGVGEEALETISDTPELSALLAATEISTVYLGDKLVDCEWDEETKRRIVGLHHAERNRTWKYYARREVNVGEKERYNQWADEDKAKTRRVLGDLRPLRSKDIRQLIEEVVDRELPGILASNTPGV
ncbi:hypothetical protein A2630_03010 [Candidatus Woesebacteria bacterium RIFCSPHIGHO2_01_FULL_44_10]|uniref:Uncharacterized protein n=1 Tax=Candidatus Woesebacteria bacterium RIFCSPLOWO2_01_FULL_44_14 TaxID=1802525 RepID=A0A1F8C3U7_9BACT|nr:MAG: hypothetical protein A2630_03010 [Candidatus Woesebacteria bacterium RIFCSPHIGHO2_01_FULL_44_10]OGM55752.1 MAG: hypothetical protein A3F62_04700 [Candidatus Woesebacteria bacterium RIFCSPHIGHO2_12_FULL_44_11]OGM70539.1 MAG: hypothetical protein A2975_02040 [Candidatus Woesebacteria bacterium RIFCSPLOWO2_01_FULL_44_14]